MAEIKSVSKSAVKRRQVEKKSKASRGGAYNDMVHPFVKAAKSVLLSDAAWVEVKSSRVDAPLKVPRAPTVSIESARSLLDPKRNYEFRLASGTYVAQISSNVVAATTSFTPVGVAVEWSGVIDALFDEYRVDRVEIHYSITIPTSGNTALIDKGFFAVGSDFDNATAPTSYSQVMSYSDGRLIGAFGQSASSYFVREKIPIHVHTSHMPRTVVTAGTAASAEWIGVAENWPGGQSFYMDATGTNGVNAMYRLIVFYVRCRMRR